MCPLTCFVIICANPTDAYSAAIVKDIRDVINASAPPITASTDLSIIEKELKGAHGGTQNAGGTKTLIEMILSIKKLRQSTIPKVISEAKTLFPSEVWDADIQEASENRNRDDASDTYEEISATALSLNIEELKSVLCVDVEKQNLSSAQALLLQRLVELEAYVITKYISSVENSVKAIVSAGVCTLSKEVRDKIIAK